MATLGNLFERLRGIDPEALLGLRPPYPPVAVEIDRGEAVLVRLKQKRAGSAVLEAHAVRPVPEGAIPSSIFETGSVPGEELSARLQELFESSGTRPGRISLVLPDNLAKISLLDLPERPASSRQLDELVRSKMRRAVPFRLEEACLAYQVLPGAGRRVAVLVTLVRRALVEQFETALERLGTRLGLIDICTPNLINLCRGRIAEAGRAGGDVALLNCASHYFSLVIVRDERLVFFRCKTFASVDRQAGPNGALTREMASSLSYYREKLEGQGIGTLIVRSADLPTESLIERLSGSDFSHIEPVHPGSGLKRADGGSLDADLVQRLAPALGAAVGRAR